MTARTRAARTARLDEPAALPGDPRGLARALAGVPRGTGRLPRPRAGDLLDLLTSECRGAEACALSGGMDSALLLALSGAPRAFTLADGAPEGDAEVARAEQAAARAGVPLHVVAVDPAALPARFEDAVRAARHLIWDPRGVAKHLLWREVAAAGVRSCLSGVGADEALMGSPAAVDQGAFAWSPPVPAAALCTRPGRRPAPPRCRVATPEAARDLLLRAAPHTTLPVEVATGRAAGVDVRLPYLSRPFVAAARALPPEALLRAGFGKVALREAAERVLPPPLCWLPKVPVLRPPPPPLRREWLEAAAPHLAPARLGTLPVDPAAVPPLLRCAASDSPDAPAALRAVLALASASILRA